MSAAGKVPRPNALDQVGPLAEQPPLSGAGIREVLCLRAVTTGPVQHDCDVTAWSPRTEDGKRPPRPSRLLAHEPHLERVRTRDADTEGTPFEYDGVAIRAQVRFPVGTSFHGAGSVVAPFRRDGRRVVFWNTDAWGFDDATPSLYQSHPYVLAVLEDGGAVGLLADSARRGAVEIAPDGVEFQFEREPFDLYRIEGADPLQVTRGLAALVGTLPLPPLWALGYHQCRWSYTSADEVRLIAAEFRRRGVPCDAMWLDIDYMDRHRVFTWNDETFPDPGELTGELREKEIRTVAILDPGVAIDAESEVHAEGLAGAHFVEDSGGRPVAGRVWPGLCHFPDFTAEKTRTWWAGRCAAFVEAAGVEGLWVDMNEPSVFRVPTRTLPEDARHAGNEGEGGSHARWHNLYGQLMARATREGLERARPDRRPFVLTRAGALSTARFAAAWTGDNQSRWEDLAWSLPMVLSLGICGQPFAGADVGGFQGDPSPELFERWFEVGALLPFFRGHSERTAGRKEPWVFGPDVLDRVRASIERRMRLLPLLYTLFREAEETGLPVVRPLLFADPTDPDLRAVGDAFLLGEALLVAPVLEPGAEERVVTLPCGGWYPFDAGGRRIEGRASRVTAPLGVLPLLARAGAIVPTCEPREAAAAGYGERLTLHVFLDAAGRARGRIYEDAGDGFAHRSDGFLDTRYAARVEGDEVVIERDASGAFDPGPRRLAVRVHGAPGAETALTAELVGARVSLPIP